MRKYQKKQLFEKFQILYDAHECIKNLMYDEQNTAQLLSDCQGLAIEIGTDIENIEGSAVKTIALLEDYCELCYQISERKFPASYFQLAEAVKKELDNKIQYAEESFKEDIDEQTIIVFFPYKASMWDSMETIWRKCKQDHNVETIVVPLPYYIKDREQKKVKRCYEGKDFSDDVSIINYEDFLCGKYYADIAIYHNPYDNTNNVTEVDSMFFSSRLHEYANMIIYIPYYVLTDKPDLSFIMAPGVKNADYVILQDEENAEEFRRWYPSEKEKFLPLGSPKIDKAIEMKGVSREKLDIAEEWKNRIRGKRVLFYNTHLVNFLDEDRDLISKLRLVFKTISKHEDIVIWWRPHPLSDEIEYTTSQMKRFQKYEELVEWYKKNDVGIYDDTPKLHEAIAASDAYYGDRSSVVKLFQSVGKPVMIQQTYDLPNMYKKTIESICIVKDKMWYTSNVYNGLFYMDMNTYETHFVGQIPEEDLLSYHLYRKILYYKEKLILIPFNANDIAIYDIAENIFHKCKINVEGKEKFYTGAIFMDNLYLLPYASHEMICYNIEKNTVSRLEKTTEKILQLTVNKWIVVSVQVYNDKLWFPLLNTNILCEYDPINDRLGAINFPKNEMLCSVLAIDKGIFLSVLNKSCAFYFEPEKKNLKSYSFKEIYPIEDDGEVYTKLYSIGDLVYINPLHTNNMIVIDLLSDIVKLKKIFPNLEESEVGNIEKYGEEFIKLPSVTKERLYFENGIECELKHKGYEKRIFKEGVKNETVLESYIFDFHMYIQYLLDNGQL